ncbi:hypothetical protein PG997_014897 [Apiospora hydei]|uniref:Uncharacterized protein n=1 Tax=Apiospora hydei TaxID=1337664 RepID=A0ABR1UV75_9PEZI
MSYSALPPETTHEILVQVAIEVARVRDLRKVLRLRHGNRSWDAAVVRALFAAADNVGDIYQKWPAFLAYRASGRGPQDALQRPVLMLRRVAERLVSHRGGNRQEDHDAVRNCISEICATMKPSRVFETEHIKRYCCKPISEDDEQLVQTLLAVAASTNEIPLVRKLLCDIRYRPYLVASDGKDSRPQ